MAYTKKYKKINLFRDNLFQKVYTLTFVSKRLHPNINLVYEGYTERYQDRPHRLPHMGELPLW